MKNKMPAVGSVTLEVLNPTGAAEITHLHAPRLDTLAGKTIGELWNRSFRGDSTFPLIREALQRQFPGVKIIPYTEFPVGVTEIDSDKTADLIKQKGCQAVIVGNAG